MTAYVAPYSPSFPDWQRQVSGAINPALAKLANIVDIKADFGAAGDGVTDDTGAINAFLAAVAGGSYGRLQAGTYKFTSALAPIIGNNINIAGSGEGVTLLYAGASTTPGDLLTFGDGTTLYFGLNLSGFTVGSSTSLTAGAAIRIKKTQYVELDVVLNGPTGNQGKLYNGVYATASNYLSFHHSRFFAKNECAKFSTCLEIHMGDAWISSVSTTGTIGIHLAGGNAAFYSERTRQAGSQYGLLSDNTDSATANNQIFLHAGSVFDSNATAGLYVNDTGTTSISKFIHADGWFASSSSGSGVSVAAFTNGKLFSGIGTFINNSGSGINLVDSTVTVSLGPGTKITDNTGYGVLSSSAMTIESTAKPFNNGSGAYHSNVTVQAMRFGTQISSVIPTAAWANDYTANTVTVSNAANVALPVGAGKILVTNPANGDVGEYNVGGGGVTFIGSTASTWVAPTTTPAAGKASITWDGTSAYRIYNNFGSSQSFIVGLVARMRTTA